MSVVCLSKFSLLSRVSPRYLMDSTISTGSLLIIVGLWMKLCAELCVLEVLIINYFVFLTLSCR